MAAIVTLTMNPALDLTSDTEALDPGHKTRCAPPRRTPGGGGINVARGLRQLLAELDVPARTLPIIGDLRQNLSLRAHDTGEVLHLVFPGPELNEQEWQACDDAMASLDPVPDLVVMSGSLPPGVPLDFYAGVARRVAGRGSRVVLDTNGPALRATLDAGAPLYLIKPNRNECRELFDVAGDDPDDYLAALDDILRDGAAEAVVVTLGAQGAVLASRDLRVYLRPPAIEGRAPVGAGDSFVSALVHRLAAGDALLLAAIDGVAAAAAAVKTRDTSLFRPDDLPALGAEVEVRHSPSGHGRGN
jgi:6-phosphofructokinase 2